MSCEGSVLVVYELRTTQFRFCCVIPGSIDQFKSLFVGPLSVDQIHICICISKNVPKVYHDLNRKVIEVLKNVDAWCGDKGSLGVTLDIWKHNHTNRLYHNHLSFY